MPTTSLRRALAAAGALLLFAACADEFAVDPPDGFTATIEQDWDDELIVGDTVTLRVVVRDQATGALVDPAGIDWTVTPANALQIVGADGDSVRFRVAALGTIGIEAALDDPAFDTATVAADLTSLLAGVTVELASADTLRSLGDTAVVRVRGLDAYGAIFPATGFTWSVSGAAVTPTGSQALDSLRVIAGANGSAWVIATHAQCAGDCRDSVLIDVSQRAAAITLSADSLRLEALTATGLLGATVTDARGQVIAGTSGITWESSAPGLATVTPNPSVPTQATVAAAANGELVVRARLGALVDSASVRVAQRATQVVEVAGDDQTGTVATLLADSLRLEARDALGYAVAGAPVGWITVDAGGSVTGSALTGANGRAAAVWSLGTQAGPQAALGYIAGVDTARFSASAVAGAPATVVASVDSVALFWIGDSASLSASVTDAFGNPRSATVTWSALDAGIVSVAAGGSIAATGNGTARVEARVNGASDTVVVVVRQVPLLVSLSVDSLRLSALGASAAVTVTVRDSGNAIIAAPQGLTWETTAASVASVAAGADSTQATVTAVGNGSTFLRVRLGALADEASVVVQQVVVNAIAVGGADQSGLVSTVLADSLRVEARDALGMPVPNAPVTWSVLLGGGSVSGSSLTGANGRAAVAWTLGSAVGPQQARAAITGADPVLFSATGLTGAATQLTVTPASALLTFVQDTAHLTAVARDAFGNVVPVAVTWSSTNEAVATVGATGIVTATGNGSASIVAQAGLLADTSVVTIQQHVASITLAPAGADTLSAGDTLRLVATARDSSGTTNTGAPITWTSTDTLVATVDGTGKVTARTRGAATIRAGSNGALADFGLTVASFALRFDGGDVLEVANSAGGPLNLDSAFTLEMWVRPRSTAGGTLIGIWNEGQKSGSSYALALRGLVLRGLTRNATGNDVDSVSATLALVPDAWHHVAFVFQDSVGTIYVNGVLVGTALSMTLPQQQASAPLRIGADASCTATATCFVGDIDEVRIWSRARSAAEILAEQALRLNVQAGLSLYFPLYLGTGDPVDVVGGLIGVRGDNLGPAAAPAWIIDGSPAP